MPVAIVDGRENLLVAPSLVDTCCRRPTPSMGTRPPCWFQLIAVSHTRTILAVQQPRVIIIACNTRCNQQWLFENAAVLMGWGSHQWLRWGEPPRSSFGRMYTLYSARTPFEGVAPPRGGYAGEKRSTRRDSCCSKSISSRSAIIAPSPKYRQFTVSRHILAALIDR
jgi:hypothetical protein